MIPTPWRTKGAGPQLGAKGPHQSGPFGRWPDEDDDEVLSGSRKDPSDQDDEQQHQTEEGES